MRANFLEKMNYLIDTLYDLSQKSGRPAQEGSSDQGSECSGPVGTTMTDQMRYARTLRG